METARENTISGRERRRTLRRFAHIPAYATLNGNSKSSSLELWQILNISESGTCIQAPGQMKVNRLLPLVLDLSETAARIHTAGHVVWAESSGKTGIRFPELPEASLYQLQQWMSMNDEASKQNQEILMEASPRLRQRAIQMKPNSAASYSSLIAEWAEIQKDVELFGPNLESALQVIAERALALTWASGSTIALKDEDHPSDLICVARAGLDSPELGVRLDARLGLCGDCVRTSTVQKCDDTERDVSAESQGLRTRGIRSVIACPIKTIKGGIIGVFEIFSAEPAAFWDNDGRTIERLSRIVVKAVSCARQSAGKPLPLIDPAKIQPPQPRPVETSHSESALPPEESSETGRTVILFATGILSVVFAVWLIAPWISEAMSSFISPPKSQAAETARASVDYAGMNIEDLTKAASSGSPTAQYAVAMRYAAGDGVEQDYHQALDWFLKAAENGDMRASAKIASCFWAGRGTPQDYTKAYFWGLLAQAAGDEAGRVIVINSAPHLTDLRRATEQQEADAWLRAHRSGSPRASR